LASSEAASAPVQVQQKPKRIAGAIVAGHAFQHMYADGFLVLLDSIYQSFGLNPVSAGALSAVRQGAGGLLTMGGGFIVDMFAGKRGLLLSGSLFAMGLGYLLVAAAPNYTILLITLGIGSGAASFWHPVGLGILSTSFPNRRAFMMSIHRSAGGIGETVTPLVVGAALFAISWREVLLAGFFLMTAVSLTLLVVLSKLGLQTQATEKRSAGEQARSIGALFKERALPTLLIVSGLRGMGDRALVFFLPLFIGESMRHDNPDVSLERVAFVIGLHLTLMSSMSIVVPPVIGLLADRIGRKPVMLVTLTGTTIITGLLALVGEMGWSFSVLIGALGAVRFAVTNLTQAASLDIAEGKRLEGSMIGLLWGNNATFGALSPLLIGGLIAVFSTGDNEFALIFPYVAVLTLGATIAALFLPGDLGKPKPQETQSAAS
jgi:MFS family permease